MTPTTVLRGRFATAALFAASVFTAVSAVRPVRSEDPVIEVTARDVSASNQKIGMAFGALVTMWTNDFKQIGTQFVAPRIARYEGAVRSPCGVIERNNAEYCPRNNAIYYDEVFVAGMEKSAARSLGTDGDMAGIGIIAHEMGHAVALQLGHEFRSSYDNESTADCLAGAFAQQAGRDGSLEKGDVEEAFYGMSLAGDPTPEATGNPRVDRMIQLRIARQSHGTKEQRTENFRAGLDGGAGACLEEFKIGR